MKKVKGVPFKAPAEHRTPAQRIRSDIRVLREKFSYTRVLTNIPYIAFCALLAVIYIANSHRAVDIQRELNKRQQVLKELRWRFMDSKTRLMNVGMDTETIRASVPLGLKPLTLPAYSIVVSKKKSKQ